MRIRRMRLARGKTLFRSGENLESLHIVRSGCIKEIDDSSCRYNAMINFALPGEMLGLQGLGNGRYGTTGIAVDPSFICVIPRAAFSQWCADSPRVATEFIRLVAKAGSAARELLALIRDKEALARVSGFLLNVSGRLQHRGVRGRDFRLGMTRDDIASYLGMRSETVSRCFTELARRRLIRVSAKRVQILRGTELLDVFQGV